MNLAPSRPRKPSSEINLFSLRLRAFAGDIPRPTGARSAPYEKPRAFAAELFFSAAV
jgi:hypothetical protein